VNDYEILLMLDPELSEEQQGTLIARTRELIEKGGGSVDRHDAWGRRKLAYEINKKGEGTYHLLLFSCGAETLDEVSRVLKIEDTVMRHMATRRTAGGSVDIAISQPPPPEPSPAPTRSAPAPVVETAPVETASEEPVAVAAPASEDVADDPVVASEPAAAAEEPAAAEEVPTAAEEPAAAEEEEE
jgi:small subunit ribosomal protein S6